MGVSGHLLETKLYVELFCASFFHSIYYIFYIISYVLSFLGLVNLHVASKFFLTLFATSLHTCSERMGCGAPDISCTHSSMGVQSNKMSFWLWSYKYKLCKYWLGLVNLHVASEDFLTLFVTNPHVCSERYVRFSEHFLDTQLYLELFNTVFHTLFNIYLIIHFVLGWSDYVNFHVACYTNYFLTLAYVRYSAHGWSMLKF